MPKDWASFLDDDTATEVKPSKWEQFLEESPPSPPSPPAPEAFDRALRRQSDLLEPSGLASTTAGGPAKIVAPGDPFLPLRDKSGFDIAYAPLDVEPRMNLAGLVPEVSPRESWKTAALKEVTRSAASLPDFFTSDARVTTALLSMVPALRPIIGAYWAQDLLRGAYKQAMDATDNWGKLTEAQKAQAIVNVSLGTAFGLASAGLGMGPRLRSVSPAALGETVRRIPPGQEGAATAIKVLEQAKTAQKEMPGVPPPVVPPEEKQPTPAAEAVTAAGEAPAKATAAAMEAGRAAPAVASAEAQARAAGAVEGGTAVVETGKRRVEGAPVEPKLITQEDWYSASQQLRQNGFDETTAKAIAGASNIDAAMKFAKDFIDKWMYGADLEGTGLAPQHPHVQSILESARQAEAIAAEIYTLAHPEFKGSPSHVEAIAQFVNNAWEMDKQDAQKIIDDVRKKWEQPAAPAAQPKETDATQERKVQEGVQPERVGTEAQRVSAEAGVGDSLQPAAPKPKAEAPARSARESVLLRKPTAKDYRDRNLFPGEHYAAKPNSIIVQIRGLDTIPIGSGKPLVFPFTGDLSEAGRIIYEKAIPKLNQLGGSKRESIFKATDENGRAIYHFQYNAAEGKVSVTTQAELDYAREQYRAMTAAAEGAPTTVDVEAEVVKEPLQLKASEPAAGKGKEPWETPRAEWVSKASTSNVRPMAESTASTLHRNSVRLALKDRKPVPPEVLADYPDLKPPEPAKGVGKAQAEVSKVAATEGKRSAAEIKQELIDEIQERLIKAPAEAKPGDTVTIDIPDDGRFVIPNTIDALTEVLARAKKIKTDVKPPGVSKKAAKSSSEAIRRSQGSNEEIRRAKEQLAREAKERDEALAKLRSEPIKDEFTEKHFLNWLNSTVPEDYRLDVETEIRAYMKHDPEVLNHASWPEIRERARQYRVDQEIAKAQRSTGIPGEAPSAPTAGTPPISPGPGAAAAGTPGTGSAIRELGDYIAALPKLDAKQKLTLAERWAEAKSAGKDLGTRLALKGAAITESIKSTARGVRRPTEIGNAVGQLDFLLQQSAGESLRTRKQLEHAIPDRATREALWIYADAKGDLQAIRDTLAVMPRDTKATVRRALEKALNLPQAAKDWLPFIEQFYGRKFAEAEAEGVLHEALPDYFTHVWRLKEDMPGSVQSALNSGKISEYFRYARERKLSTMLEGIKNPTMIPGMRMEPVLDAAKIMPHYNYALDRAIASRRFMRQLNEMTASDGRPLVAPSGRSIPSEELKWAVINDATGQADPFVKGIFDTEAEANAEAATRGAGYHVEQRKNEFLMIKSRIRPEELAGYRPIDHPSMRKWQWATTEKDGKTVLYEGELLAHPEVYERLARMMDRSRLTPGKGTAAALRYSGEIKAAKLGLLSTFHQVHVAKHAIFHWTNPFRAEPIDWDAPTTRYAIEKGHLKLAPEPGELNQFAEGILADEAIIHKLPIVGELSRRYSEYLFTDYIPRLKLATFENALKRNMDIYGAGRGIGGAIKAFGAKPISEAEIAARVGDSVNAAFGELNKLWLGKQGRDPRFQRALRLIFLAPDFGEARLRFLGKAFTKYGAEERFALAMNFATIYGLARVANWLATGDPHADDPKHWFDVKVGDHWWSMRSVLYDVAHFFRDPGRFSRVRLNPGLVDPVIEFIGGRDWRGQKRTGWQEVGDYASKLVPISLQALTQDDRHVWEGFAGSMGFAPRRADAVSQMHEKAARYRDVIGIKNPVEVQESPAGSPYRTARIAIEFNDPRKFWRALTDQYHQLQLRHNPDPAGTIQEAFERYYARPFTGSERTEQAFKASLNAREKKLYEDAQKERKEAMAKFNLWWKDHNYVFTGKR